jgi:hypothetical protein
MASAWSAMAYLGRGGGCATAPFGLTIISFWLLICRFGFQNALNLTYAHLQIQKSSRGVN